MKRLLIALFAMAMLAPYGFAVEYKLPIHYKKKNNGSGTTVSRAPMMLPIEVVYDDEENRIDVVGDDLEAVVYLYDQSGAVVGYSSTLSASFYVSAPGSYTLLIEGDGWTGEGYVEI